MKKLLLFVLTGLMFAACTKEEDSPEIVAEMVDMHVVGVDVKSIITDKDVALPFDPSMKVAEALSRPDTTYRALMYYTLEEGEFIKIYSSSRAILLEPDENCSIKKTDKVFLNALWLSENKKYLNLRVGMMIGNSDDGNIYQTVGLMLNSVKENENGGKTYVMTFTHDQMGMPEYYSIEKYMSIPTSQYGKNDEIELHVKTYYGDVVKKIKFDGE